MSGGGADGFPAETTDDAEQVPLEGVDTDRHKEWRHRGHGAVKPVSGEREMAIDHDGGFNGSENSSSQLHS